METVANGDRGYFNFWVWAAGNKAVSDKYRYRISVGSGTAEEVTYSASPLCLEVGLETIREDQISLLLADSAIRRLIR